MIFSALACKNVSRSRPLCGPTFPLARPRITLLSSTASWPLIVRERETAEEAQRDRRFEPAEISFVNRRIDITQLKVQAIDQLGTLLAEILNGSLSFTNRLSKLAEVVR